MKTESSSCSHHCRLLCLRQGHREKYEPTEVQNLELKVMHRDIEIAQITFQEAQANLTAKYNSMTAKAEEIKKENKWPADLIFKPDPMTFDHHRNLHQRRCPRRNSYGDTRQP